MDILLAYKFVAVIHYERPFLSEKSWFQETSAVSTKEKKLIFGWLKLRK